MPPLSPSENLDGIAIIGTAGRFPGASNVDQFWRNLRDGVESISRLSDDELLAAGVAPEVLADPNYVKTASVLGNEQLFDGQFFGYSPRESEILDPQHRFFLECAWEVLESAGYNPLSSHDRVGVYAGASENDYWQHNLRQFSNNGDALAYFSALVANDKDYLATRVSYKLNLTGPSLTVQTACSTSLVAVHLACQALLNGECDRAIAGGVSIRVPQNVGYQFTEGMIFSPDGHCRAFDAQAHGTVFGSGVGVVLLKRLADAVSDGDPILAVIRGSAINNDGSGKIGYTAPSLESQAAVIAEALGIADVDPETVGYIECHGTGTPLGDPIEIAALTKAFRSFTPKKKFCAVGSVKTNVGHLNVAAGISGLIKVVQALRQKQIPPSLHFEKPNPNIDFENSPFYVNAKLTEWRTTTTPRRAGVSSFGVGGTNAHVVVEEAPLVQPSAPSKPWQLLVLSAKSAAALEVATTNLAEHLKLHPGLNLADVAYTLQLGRQAMDYRRVVTCRDQADAEHLLQTLDSKQVSTGFHDQRRRSVVFMFTGQGSQYVNMAHQLYQTEPVFRRQVDRCAEILKPHLGLDIRGLLYPTTGRSDDTAQQLTQTAYAQPALFTIEYAVAQLLMAWGLNPQAMIGHSVGEFVAACLAGVFSLEDGLFLVATRGRLMNALPTGSMLAVPLPEAEVLPLLNSELSLATINASSACVVSGTSDAIDKLTKELAAQGIEGRRLHTSHAFHSQMLAPMLDPFREHVRKIKLNAPSIPYLSNVTGDWITKEQATDPDYWVRHTRQTVRFADGVEKLLQEPGRVLLEVGPGDTLTQLAKRHPRKNADHIILPSIRHPRDEQSDTAFLLGTVGRLWLAGVDVDWNKLHHGEQRHRLSLPTYPFERQRYWVDPQDEEPDGIETPRTTPTDNVEDWFYVPSWKQAVSFSNDSNDRDAQGLRLLVFVDTAGLGAPLVAKLSQHNHSTITVKVGQHFATHDDGSYSINPDNPEDYHLLFGSLADSGNMPNGIVHLWTVTSLACNDSLFTKTDASQTLGFFSLLYLAQALGRQSNSSALNLWVISNNLFDVTGGEDLAPEKATILGPCKTLPQEFPHISCHCVDIEYPERADNRHFRLVDQLVAEIQSATADAVVAFRGRHRWVQTFEPVKLKPAPEKNTRLQQGGVYLITGGLGGIGLVIAEYLARSVNAKLILVGRTALPERNQWEAWLTSHSNDNATSRRIHQVLRLEELGAEVMVVAADIASLEQMREALVSATRRFGAINGVVHAAGIAGGGIMQRKSREIADGVLAPKVRGTLVLDALLKDSPPAWLALCSSTYAITSQFGQVDYCAANCFLDAFAHYKASRDGTSVVSINWDGWREVGMAVNAAQSANQLKTTSSPGRQVGHPLLGTCIQESSAQAIFRTDFSVDTHWVLAEHQVGGEAVVPGTAFLEMVRAAIHDQSQQATLAFSNVYFLTPLSVLVTERKEVFTLLERQGDVYEFRILGRSTAHGTNTPTWIEHAKGSARVGVSPTSRMIDIAEIQSRCRLVEPLSPMEPQPLNQTALVQWGRRWQCVNKIYLGQQEVLGELELGPDFAGDLNAFAMHPALLDVAASLACCYADDSQYIPFSYEELTIQKSLPARLFACATFIQKPSEKNEVVSCDVVLMSEQGEVLVEIKGVSFRRVDTTTADTLSSQSGRHSSPSASVGVAADRALFYEALMSHQDQPRGLESGISNTQGIEAFARILNQDAAPQVIVSTRDFRIASDKSTPPATRKRKGALTLESSAATEHSRPETGTAFVPPRTESEQALAQFWQDALGIAKIGINDNFFELGGDSIIAIQIIAKANKAGIELATNDIFEYPTIGQLAAARGAPVQTNDKQMEVAPETHSAGVADTSLEANDFGWSEDDLKAISGAIAKSLGEDR